MTTIVYTEEVTTSSSPNSSPVNIQRLTVKIMDDRKSGAGGTPMHQRGGSPKPQKSTRFSVRGTRKVQGQFPAGYNPNVFTITAYLPHDGGRRLKLQCMAGMTVQQVIETEIPDISKTGYQVYQFPSRALLNPEKDASVLQDQEISIEPMKLSGADEIEDERQAIVKELLRTEDGYLENLKNIFDIYMEPLRKWGMPQEDLNTLFRSLSRLCDLLMNFFSELELAVKYWNTSKTLIGGLFKQYPSFWDMYEEYAHSYTRACRLLKEKKTLDESFQRFLLMKRGAAMHTLESLMLLPVQRIYDYHRLLVQLYTITAKDHPDYHDLRYTVACVSTMVQARERQLNQYQNESKLDQVQLRFPHDTLFLDKALDYMESPAKKMSKNMSSPSVSRAHSDQRKKHSAPVLDLTDGGMRQSGRRQSMRLYLQEGPVKIIQGLQTHERFLFIFDDLLLIAKPTGRQRSQHRTYKLKQRLRLSEMWVTDCVDEVLETTLPPKTAFVVGWPITNCVASFATPEEKSLWHGLLSKNISAQRQLVHPDSVSIRIVNLTKSSNNLPIWMQVHASEQARDVLSRALDLFAIAVAESNCQMWVKYSRDEAAYPLIGHEYPFAIQIHHNRHQVDYSNAGEGRPTQLQFVIKRKSAVPGDLQSSPQQAPRTKKAFKRTNLLAWYRVARGKKGRDGGRQKYRMFGAPLNTIMINGQLPEILQEMMIRLYTDGPSTMGIFRQSANHRKVKETKEAIDNRVQVDLAELSIHVIGALVKEILRNLPGGILMSSRYTEFVATNDIKDVPTRVYHIQKVLSKLPEENQVFLAYLMPLFHCIARNEEINGMNSVNLAICCAPSLLWPDSGLDVIKNEVPPLVQFMVEYCPEIFGSELPELYKQLPVSPGMVLYVPTKVDDGEPMTFQRGRSDSLDTSTSEESAGEDEPVSTLLRARRSGLTVSDSQLSVLSHQLEEFEKAKAGTRVLASREMELDGRHIAEQMMELEPGPPSPTRRPPSPKRQKRSHRPERSNSYRTPGEKVNIRVRHLDPNDVVSRRKSIATQTTLERPKRRGELFPHDFHVVPPSPNSSLSSQSLGFSPYLRAPHLMESIEDEPEVPPFEYQPGDLFHRHKSSQKKRRTPQYSHSFSKESENKPEKPLPTSHSYYDKLLPLDPEARGRSRSMANPTTVVLRAPRSHHGSLESELTGSAKWPTDHIANGEVHEAMGVMSPLRAPMGTVELGKPAHPHTSSQSVASSRSGSSNGSQPQILRTSGQPSSVQNRHSNLSQASSHSGGSGGSVNRASPDPLSVLEQTPMHKMDREFVKVAISKRFGISSLDFPPSSTPRDGRAPYVRSSSLSNPTPYHDDKRTRMWATKAEPSYPKDSHPVDGNRQVKMDARMRANSDLSHTKAFGSVEKKKGQLRMVVESQSFDDRPESEQHLNSLPRPPIGELIKPPHMQPMQPFISGPPEIVQVATMAEHEHEHDPSRLYLGYNSDTESSPSRTLSRPEKLLEVASPPGKSMPSRYKTHVMYPGIGVDRSRRYQSTYESPYRSVVPSSSAYPKMFRQHPGPSSEASGLPTKPPEAGRVSPPRKEVSVASEDEKVTTVTRQTSFHTVIDVNKRRGAAEENPPQQQQQQQRQPVVTRAVAGTEGKVGVTMVKVRSSESPKAERSFSLRERETANVLESAKVGLGLIPRYPRQRSKSTSDDEAMRIIHKVVEEPEEGREGQQEADKSKKYEGWLSCAPTSTERRLAWEQRARSASKPTVARDLRSRSLRQDTVGASPVLPPKTIRQPSPALQRKSSTMPELSVRSGRPGVRRIGMVRTVKITSYFVPEPQRIRRINLRTYYS